MFVQILFLMLIKLSDIIYGTSQLHPLSSFYAICGIYIRVNNNNNNNNYNNYNNINNNNNNNNNKNNNKG